ncbi:hypothetical protein SPMU_33030 [Sphingomonas mucosissima]|uniref:Uncharacterized protein n=1 Tax=Sphingomonas mucosissima TaxID=370959 RepID=A0A245ZDP6_9SPHN|nr:hypothetical protein SPMU_33030 [Sphingomonas mucosissima]
MDLQRTLSHGAGDVGLAVDHATRLTNRFQARRQPVEAR